MSIRQKLLILFLGSLSLPVQASEMNYTQSLSFGTWVPTASSGSIIVTQSGTVSSSSGVTQAPSGTAVTQGILRFSSTGSLGAVLDVITLTALSSSVTLTGSRGTVVVNNFTPQSGLGVTLLSPNVNIPVGATLSFSDTPSGTYTGNVQMRGSGLLSGSATGTLPITVTFWQTLSATQQTQLNFGAVELLSGNSVIQINAQTGNRSIVSGASGINLIASPSPSAGSFQITGQANTTLTVTLPSSITLTGSNGGTMTVNTFTRYPTTLTLNSSGSGTLSIGANLTIGANQAAGTYTGTYQVTINY